MTEGIFRALQALRDVAGVRGSFVLSPNGELLGKDLPPVFHEGLFVQVGARLSRLVETLATDGDQVGSVVMRFDVHRLSVTRSAQGLLAVVTDGEVNGAALNMAITLTARRLDAEVGALDRTRLPAAFVSQGVRT